MYYTIDVKGTSKDLLRECRKRNFEVKNIKELQHGTTVGTIMGDDDTYCDLVEWLSEEPRTAPYPDGALLYHSVGRREFQRPA